MKKIKRKCILLLMAITLFYMQIPVMADDENVSSVDREVIYLENGDCIISTITMIQTRSSYVQGSHSIGYQYDNGQLAWSATITGTFSYNGERANCESAYMTTEFYDNNWTFTAKNSYRFGSTAYGELTAKFDSGLSIPWSLPPVQFSIWCDADGNLYRNTKYIE